MMQGHDMLKRYGVRVATAVAALLPVVSGCTVGGAAAGGCVVHEAPIGKCLKPWKRQRIVEIAAFIVL
jgi:hypothetical protein